MLEILGEYISLAIIMKYGSNSYMLEISRGYFKALFVSLEGNGWEGFGKKGRSRWKK